MNLNINPVAGECYGNALKLVLENMNQELTIVHGLVTGQGPIKGHRITHAWTEDKEFCYDMNANTMQMTPMPKIAYYILGKIQIHETVRYTGKEIRDLVLESGHAGPFNERLLEHAINEIGSVYEKIT